MQAMLWCLPTNTQLKLCHMSLSFVLWCQDVRCPMRLDGLAPVPWGPIVYFPSWVFFANAYETRQEIVRLSTTIVHVSSSSGSSSESTLLAASVTVPMLARSHYHHACIHYHKNGHLVERLISSSIKSSGILLVRKAADSLFSRDSPLVVVLL